MNKATLRLFNTIQKPDKVITCFKQEITSYVFSHSVRNGYIIASDMCISDDILDDIDSVIGISGEKVNAAFHKSWSVIRDSDIEDLVTQQIIHYITTYGFEALGIYREDTVYIPAEILVLPGIDIHNITDDIPLTIIKALTADEILEKIVSLASGIALSPESLSDIMTIIKANKYDYAFINQIKNRELKAMLFDHYGIVPAEPTEFLRHLISKLTDESLLIKNDYLINKIKESDRKFLDHLLKDAPNDLASIFYRYKPLFLAMKSISNNKTFFNQLRKKARKQHVPLKDDYLNNITAMIKNNRFDLDELEKRLSTASIFRKIRLAYALNFRLDPGNSIVYKVRNGKGWATDFKWSNFNVISNGSAMIATLAALTVVKNSIAQDLKPNVEGKTFYIPENVNYTLPATEKQFTGNMPSGSYVSVPDDLIVGIHWFDTEHTDNDFNFGTDLDLSVIGESGKIGWDASYRTENRDVLFSGDMTSAPKPDGASELFYFRKDIPEARLLIVNYYNFNAADPVECKIIVAKENPGMLEMNYMVDVSNIIASANIKITKKQNIIGMAINVDGENRVYFSSVSIGNSISASDNEHATHTRKFLINSMVNSISLSDVLEKAGAVIVREKSEKDIGIDFVDLSPHNLDKTTIIDLLKVG